MNTYPDNINTLYARLSQEDTLDGESNSMANQKNFTQVYNQQRFFQPNLFIDDGVSGVTFDRPGWNEMIRLAEEGKVKQEYVPHGAGLSESRLLYRELLCGA